MLLPAQPHGYWSTENKEATYCEGMRMKVNDIQKEFLKLALKYCPSKNLI
jgi:hypothetical protein